MTKWNEMQNFISELRYTTVAMTCSNIPSPLVIPWFAYIKRVLGTCFIAWAASTLMIPGFHPIVCPPEKHIMTIFIRIIGIVYVYIIHIGMDWT